MNISYVDYVLHTRLNYTTDYAPGVIYIHTIIPNPVLCARRHSVNGRNMNADIYYIVIVEIKLEMVVALCVENN